MDLEASSECKSKEQHVETFTGNFWIHLLLYFSRLHAAITPASLAP